jgi:hypothetical protein
VLINRKIALIGAGGYIGLLVARSLARANIEVIKYSHSPQDPMGETSRIFSIESPYLPTSPDFTDIVYLSWSTNRSKRSQIDSWRAALFVSDWAASHNVSVIFISSMAATLNNPKSYYGKYKKLAELRFNERNHQVIRLGTVIPPSGYAGSALISLENTSFLAKQLLKNFRPIYIPVITEERAALTISESILKQNGAQIREAYDRWDSLQSILDIFTGPIPFRRFRLVAWLLPIQKRDRVMTLIDMNELRARNPCNN